MSVAEMMAAMGASVGANAKKPTEGGYLKEGSCTTFSNSPPLEGSIGTEGSITPLYILYPQ